MGPSRPCSTMDSPMAGRPFPHLDDGPSAWGRLDEHPVHQSARSWEPESEATAGGVSVLERTLDVDDAGTVVLGAYHQRLASLPIGDRHPDRATSRVAGDVAGDLGDRGR